MIVVCDIVSVEAVVLIYLFLDQNSMLKSGPCIYARYMLESVEA